MYSSGRQRYRPTISLRRSSSKPNLSFSTITEECVPKDIHFPDDEEKRERTQRLRKLQRLRERRYRDFKGLSRSGVTDDYETRFASDLEEFRNIKTGNIHTESDALSKTQEFEHKFSRFQSRDIYNTLPAKFGARKFSENLSFSDYKKDAALSPTGSVSSAVTVDDRFMYGSRFENEESDYSWRPRHRTYSLSTASNYDYESSLYGHLNEDGLDDGPFDDTTSEYEYGYSATHGLKRSFSTCVTPHKYSGMMTPVTMSAEAAATADRLDQIKERLYNLQTMRKERETSEKSNIDRSRFSYNREVDNEQFSTSVSNYQTSESRHQSLNIPQDNNNSSRPLWSQRIDLLMSSQKQNDAQHDENFNQQSYTSVNEPTSNIKIVDGSEPVPTDVSFDQESFYSFEANEDDSSIANIKSINKNTGATEMGYDYTDCVDPGSVQISLESYNDNKFLGFEGNQILQSSTTSHTVKPIQLTQHNTYTQSHSKQNYLSRVVTPEVQSHTKPSHLGTEMQNYKDLSRDELLLEIARLKLANIERDTPKTESIAHTETVETESQVKVLPDNKANINVTKLKSFEVSSKMSSGNIQYQDPYNASVSMNNVIDKSVSITAKDSKLSEEKAPSESEEKTPSESEEEILSEFEKETQSESDEQPQSDSYVVDREENFINEKEKSQIEHSMYFKSVTVENPSVETSENMVHKITEDGLQNQYSPVIKETFEKKQNFSEENLEIKDLQNNNSLESRSLETPATQTQVSRNFFETSNSENINRDSLAESHQESFTKFDTTFDNSNNITNTFSKETNSVELNSQTYTQPVPYQAPKENSLTSREDEMLETKKLLVDVTITPNNDNITKTKSPEKCNSIAYSSTENEVEMPRALASSPLFVPSQDTYFTIMNGTVKNNTDSPSYLNELETNQGNETLTYKPLDAQNYVDADTNIKEGVDSTKLEPIEIPIKDKGIETFNDKVLSEIPTDSKNDSKYFQTELSTTHSPTKGNENSENYVLKTTKEVVVDQEQSAEIHERFSEDQHESKGKSEFIQDCPPSFITMPHVTENSKIIISTTKSSEPLYMSSLSVSLPNSPSQLTQDNIDAVPKTESVNLMEHSVKTQPSLNGVSSTSNSASIYLVPNKKYLSTSAQNQFNSDIDGKSDAKLLDMTTLEDTPEIKSPGIYFENDSTVLKAESTFMPVVKTDANNSSVTNQNETSEKPDALIIGLDALQSKSEDRLNTSEHFNNQTTESLNISPQTTLSGHELYKETPAEVANLKVYNEKDHEGSKDIFEEPSMTSTKLSNNTPELTESSFELRHQENVSMKLSPENNSKLPNYSLSSYQTALPQSSVTENNSLSSSSKIVSVESTDYVQPNFYMTKEDSPILLKKDVPSFDLNDSSELRSPKLKVNADVNNLSIENNNLNSSSKLSHSQSSYNNAVGRESSSDWQTQNFTTITPKSILVTDSPKEATSLQQSTPINVRRQIFGEEINTFDITYTKPNKSALKLVAPDSGTLIKTKYETEGERIQSIIPRSPRKKDYETNQFSDNTEYAKSDTSSKDFPDSSFQITSDSQDVISAKSRTVEIEKPVSQPDSQYLDTTSMDSMPTTQYEATSNIENVGQHTSEINMELSKNTAFSLERNNSDINSNESNTRYLHGSSQEAITLVGSRNEKPHQTVTLNNNENKDFSLKTGNTQSSSPNMQKLESSVDTIPLASNKDYYEIKAPEHINQTANVDENRPTEQWSYEETTPNFSKTNSLPRKKKKPSKTLDSPQSSEKGIISTEDNGNVNKKPSHKKWKSVELLQKGNQKKPEVPPKNSGPGLVKSTSMKFLAKFQSKSKKQKSSDEPTDLLHPTIKKGQSEYSVLSSDPSYQQDEFLGSDPEQRTRHYKTLPHKKKENSENAPGLLRRFSYGSFQYKSLKKDVGSKSKKQIDSLVSPFNAPLPKQDEDMFIEEKQSFSQWDPSALFTDLYNIHLVPDDAQDFSSDFIEMEGVMEKLPMNKKKSTLLKTWKRRYFVAKNGWLVYYDNSGDQQPSDEILLMGGSITVMGNNVIGIDDGRGHYLMVRCPSEKEYDQWLAALQSQTVDNSRANYIQPLVDAPKSSYKNILIVEMGSMSVRAGILKENVTLPQIFFPSVVAVNYSEKKHFVGFEAYKPKNRLSSKIINLFGLSDKVDKFKIEYEIFPSVFTAIFQDLKIKPSDYQIMLVMPLNISKRDKENIMKILMNRFHVQGVCMVTQAVTALYSYKTKSGIMVDIGERLEVIPIYDGFAIEGGQSVQSYGAGKIRQSLRSGLAKHNFPLYSPLEQILVRYVMEQTCYVSKTYEEEIQKYMHQPEKFLSSVYLNKYNVPNDAYSTISHDISRFASPEGFFNTDLWGMDYPTVQALVLKAINACPMDNRRHMCRAIYLSGGVTTIPGFAARLEKEVQKLVNPSLLVQVHSSPQRYHAAYIGACILSALPEFQNHCILANEWKREGTRAFQKWIY